MPKALRPESPILPKVAFLGPAGTYSHQVAYATFGKAVDYEAVGRIEDVFHAVSEGVPFAVIPQENSIFGIVVETYDVLRSIEAGRSKFVCGQSSLRVQHSLLARKGVKREEITKVMSHEQALGQCHRFLTECMPGVPVVKTTSTAAAAQALSSPESSRCAAICSSVCATVYPDLDVLQEGIQDECAGARNITRFYILGASLQIPLPLSVPEVCPKRALCRVSLTPSKTKMATATATHSRASQPCTITEVIVALALSAIRIDRRPSLTGEAFQDVYFVEMQEAHASAAPAVEQELTWELKLEGAIERVKSLGVHVVLLGSWGMWGPRCASHRL